MARTQVSAPPARGRAIALVVLCTAAVLVTIDGTIVAVALPSIQRDLDVPAGTLQWVITAYTLALGSFLLLGGRLADAFGLRRMLLVGLATFTAASLAAGLARSLLPLLVARAVTGLGAALAIPAALALITAIFEDETERTRALGYLSAGMDVGMVAGAVLGGLITSALGWPWVFFVVVPLGLATAALAPRAVPERRPGGRAGALDVRGAVLAAAGLAALVLAITLAERSGPVAPSTLATLAASAALLTAFAAAERRAPAPLLPARLLLDRRALAANLTIVANAGGFGGVIVLSTLYLQGALGFSALETGLAFVPLAVTAGAGGPLAGRLVARVGTRAVVAGGLVASAGAVLGLSRGGDYLTVVLPAFAVAGVGFAMAAVPLMAEAVAGAEPARKGVAAGLFQTFTHIGGAVVLAALLVAAAARAGAAGELAGHRLALALDAALLLAGAAVAWRRLPASAGRA